MANSRYSKIMPVYNVDEGYQKLYQYTRSNSNGIKQYPTLNLKYPTDQQIQGYVIQLETWAVGQRLYKLADKYYGDSQYWWVIAFFNKKPTEQHFSLGDTVQIPLPLSEVLSDLGL
jgi:hypothetical protein